jgi:hypothetical protein
MARGLFNLKRYLEAFLAKTRVCTCAERAAIPADDSFFTLRIPFKALFL